MLPSRQENATINIPQALLVAAQLALGLFVLVRFELEPSGRVVEHGMLWIIAAPVALFLVHAFAPLPARKPLALLAVAALLVLVLGPTATAYVVGGGLVLIGLCHLPLAYRWRVLAIVAVATGLALVQAQVIDGSRLLMMALPFFGAIFMFRLVIYLYDLRHEKPGDASAVDRVGYFFLLPAPLFLFFPTLDYKVYLRCFYARPSFEIYQTGVLWFSRGITHLILYRVIYHFYSPPAEFVVDLGGVMAFCLSGYLIYLRVSGTFHIIGGLLRLFGYDLPETHRLYFFATGFSDYWRRINIYWKDFMAKIVFFPTFAALGRRGKLGQPGRMVIATIVVFAATVFLHSYQTFWLRGDFAIHETDYYFWGLLGILVVINNLLEGRRKGGLPGKKVWDFKKALSNSAKATGMFVLLCVLWALWSSQTLERFFGVMSGVSNARPEHLTLLFGFCAAAIVLGTLGQWIAHHGFNPFVERPRPLRSVLTATLPLLLLGAAWEYQDHRVLPGELGRKFELVRIDQPNERDQAAEERSYYEVLMAGGGEAKQAAIDEDNVKEVVYDIRGRLYKASHPPIEAWGATWSSNRWRMRDQLYSKGRLPGTTRIAINGASYVMGRGVNDGETFESVAEVHLNENGVKIELLNFAMSATCSLQRVADLEMRIADFRPDVVFMFAHTGEAERNLRKIADIIAQGGRDLTYPLLRDIVEREGIGAGDSREKIIRALVPYSEEIMQFTYRRLAEVCEERGITPVWVYLPLIKSADHPEYADPGRAWAEKAGVATMELHGLFLDHTLDELKVSDVDHHPNALGHRLIAQRLIEAMREQREELGLPESIGSVPPLEVP